MDELKVAVDPETAKRIVAFAESISITPEEAASRILTIAALVRTAMKSKCLLAGGPEGDCVVSFHRLPDGSRSFDIRAAHID
jgi:hypothetical protein